MTSTGDLSSSSGPPLRSAPEPSVLSRAELALRHHIIDAPISIERLNAFREDYLRSRTAIGAAEKLFKRFNAFRVDPQPNPELPFGFNRLIAKGPLVDQSNWGDLGGWDFAVAQERYLLRKLRDTLAAAAETNGQIVSITVQRDVKSIISAADSLSKELSAWGFEPQAIILAANLDHDLFVRVEEEMAPRGWELGEDLRTNWIIGIRRSQPVLYIKDADATELYVVDVRRFATLVQHEPIVDLKVNALSRGDAERLMRERPEWGLGLDDLMGRAQLLLYQSYEVNVREPRAVIGARLE